MRSTILCTMLLVVSGAGFVRAETSPDAAARAKAVAPFIDEATVAVAHVDLARIQAGPLVDRLVELVPEAAAEGRKTKLGIDAFLGACNQAGAREIYAVVSLADVPGRGDPWFLIVPLSDASKPEVLSAALAPLGFKARERLNGVLFAGSPATLQRLRNLKPDPRPELAQAFDAAGDTAAQVLVLPPKHTRRVVEEMMPRLPDEIGGGPSTVVTSGLLWAALGADAPPRLSLRLVVRSQDSQAASALRAKLVEIAGLLGREQAVRKQVPDLDQVVKLLTPQVEGDRLTLTLSEENGAIKALFAALAPPLGQSRTQARRVASMNNLKQIGLAMHVYHDARKSFPAQASFSADGKPLLSWRVHLLPYLDQETLYKQFRLDEPWDSPANRTLIDRMPAIYRCPASKLKEAGLTNYVVPAGKGTVFPGREGVSLKDISDGSSNTILAVEVGDDRAVVWTKPEDLPFDPAQPAKGLGGPFEGGFSALFCDGSVQWLKMPQDPQNLRALLTRAGAEPASR